MDAHEKIVAAVFRFGGFVVAPLDIFAKLVLNLFPIQKLKLMVSDCDAGAESRWGDNVGYKVARLDKRLGALGVDAASIFEKKQMRLERKSKHWQDFGNRAPFFMGIAFSRARYLHSEAASYGKIAEGIQARRNSGLKKEAR